MYLEIRIYSNIHNNVLEIRISSMQRAASLFARRPSANKMHAALTYQRTSSNVPSFMQ